VQLLQPLPFNAEQYPVGEAVLAFVGTDSGAELAYEPSRDVAVLIVAKHVLQFLPAGDDLLCLRPQDWLRQLDDIPVPLAGLAGPVHKFVGVFVVAPLLRQASAASSTRLSSFLSARATYCAICFAATAAASVNGGAVCQR
jgi:hypothetical protein